MRPIVRRSPSATAYRCSVPATTSSSDPCMAELCMRKRRFVVSLSSVFVLALAGAPRGQTRWLEAYREPARRIIDESRASTFAWDRLASSETPSGAGSAVRRTSMPPSSGRPTRCAGRPRERPPRSGQGAHWVRGAESLEIVGPGRHPLAMLGLGNSIGTPPDGIEADLLVVRSFQELDASGDAPGADRPLQRPLHDLRRDRRLSE